MLTVTTSNKVGFNLEGAAAAGPVLRRLPPGSGLRRHAGVRVEQKEPAGHHRPLRPPLLPGAVPPLRARRLLAAARELRGGRPPGWDFDLVSFCRGSTVN